jgi:hypothetical protein
MAGRLGMRTAGSIGLTAFAALATGCYTLQPVRGIAPEVGTQVALDVNDSGRVALGGSMGPEIAQVEGRLLSKEDGAYLLAVSTVRLIRGGEQVWSGEQVRIKPEQVSSLYVRRFSTARSVVLGTSLAGGFAAFLVTRALRGAGNGGDPGTQPDTGQAQRGRP